MPAQPEAGNVTGEDEGGASNDLRTAVEAMEVATKSMVEVYEVEVEKYGIEAERGGLGGGMLALEATGVLTQDADPGVKTLVDARNCFNDLRRLATLWSVRHH